MSRKSDRPTWGALLYRKNLCRAVLILLGGFVLFAWGTNPVSLIQIRPKLVPMSVIAAMEFLLSGLGLIFSNFPFLREVQVVGALTLVLGGLTLLELFLP